MLYNELIRILRNPKWKYGVLIFIALIVYYVTLLDASSIELKSMLRMGQEEALQSICLMPVVLINFLLFHIALEEEHQKTWKTLLPCPIAQGKRILSKFVILFLFQAPILCIPVGMYYIMSGMYSNELLTFAWCMQIIYITSFMYYCFKVSSGYLAQMGSITIINVLKTTTPIFLFFCITNIRDWMFAYNLLWGLITGCCVVLLIVLLVCNQSFMHRKLYREMILYKLFGLLSAQRSEMVSASYHSASDKALQFMFRLFDRKSEAYWRGCAAVEVGIKQNGFFILSGCVFLFLWYVSSWFLFLPLTILAFAYVVYCCVKERMGIKRVRIT